MSMTFFIIHTPDTGGTRTRVTTTRTDTDTHTHTHGVFHLSIKSPCQYHLVSRWEGGNKVRTMNGAPAFNALAGA